MIPNRERLIKKRLARLAEAISITAGESQLARVASASQVVDYFTPDVSLALEGVNVSIQDRSDLREAVLAARTSMTQARFQFLNINLKFSEQEDVATAFVTILGNINQETNTFARDVKFSLRRVEGQWLIDSVKTIGGI